MSATITEGRPATVTTRELPPLPTGAWSRLYWTFADGWTLVQREFWYLKAQPGDLLSTLAFPAAMTLLFGFVFGSAIAVPGGGNYRAYLMPGLFALTATFAVIINAVVIAAKMSRGVIDRFRSLPMATLAVPFGQTGSDTLLGVVAIVVMVGCGLAVGWRATEGIPRAVTAFALLLLFRYAMSWVGVYLGLAVKNDKTVNSLSPLIFPLTMISNAFVPTSNMPGWLRLIANWNPVSALTAACRQLFGNPGAAVSHAAWPLEHPIVATIFWSVGLLVVFVSLSLHSYATGER
jgi:ABC-2 type transport system permease protein